METYTELLKKYRSGDKIALDKLFIKMTPLIKKYARKIHFLDYNDSSQELYLTLLECIPYLDESKTEAECLAYTKKAVENKYDSLCRKYLSMPDFVNLDTYNNLIRLMDSESETLSETIICNLLFDIDITKYIACLKKKDQLKGNILRLIYEEQLSDSAIAQKLNISRQYVNRIKKQLIYEFYH